ncbi:hypothetical protein IVA80_15255 [Bradyrhizobium sp. 139]|uniref:hypothetical protein n=1 Tax=Bradyrhizobium sp. 139 TaxID=2782616 RepID=UPI001FF90BC7|nr:hypothetical protein [Bradyrhizobium sp. 139]MCK1742181.1 hypothetical protein [Bradyrhizobium sp. 139]
MTTMLDTVADYVREARTLLQDTVPTYRYSDPELLSALNMAVLTARRLRPDLFLNLTVPYFTAVDATAFAMDAQYRVSFIYFIVGHAQLRDEEDTQDSRAAAFLGKFTQQLVGLG